MRCRIWTPDSVVRSPVGERMVRMSPKRHCNRCKTMLGDLTDQELYDATLRRKLLPVDSECGRCLGFHLVFAKPAPREPEWQPGDVDEISVSVICPGKPAGAPVEACAVWDRCGCTPPAETHSVEWASFLASPCPHSVTGEHRHLVELDTEGSPFVAAPQPGTCWYQSAIGSGDPDPAYDVIDGPGLYPVDVDAFDASTPVFIPVDVVRGRHAEATAV
jgi:hypothetical protein